MPCQMCMVCNGTNTGSPQQWECHHFDRAGNDRGQIHLDIPQEPVSGTAFSRQHRVLPLPAHTKVSAIQIKTSRSKISVLGKSISPLTFRLNPVKTKSKATHVNSNYFLRESNSLSLQDKPRENMDRQ